MEPGLSQWVRAVLVCKVIFIDRCRI